MKVFDFHFPEFDLPITDTVTHTFTSTAAIPFDPKPLITALGSLPDINVRERVRQIVVNKYPEAFETLEERPTLFGLRITENPHLPENMLIAEYMDGSVEVVLFKDGKIYKKRFDKDFLGGVKIVKKTK